ncbi:uncharacterized protein LOC109861023 [Pseudomyrmex gracilis]|uniref:uncharacterized protein LOC109861023 n=1 Tax=Pseudomyrmex gracilis TaxID=219809 RepID=UPI0009952DC8|nr:uncharacterized protein LOC109861023 [Pseudomyrmex gracilis]
MTSEQRWNNDIAYAMIHVKLIAWTIGVWPLQVYDIFSLIRCAWGIFSAALMVFLPSVEIYLGCTDAEKNTDCLMLICCGILGVIKITSFRIYANNLTNNYCSAVNDYQTVKHPRYYSIMRKHTYVGKLLCCSMMSFSYFSCFMYALIPFLGGDRFNQSVATNETALEYTLPSACAVKYFHVPTSMYTIICLFQTVAIFTATTANSGNDALFLNITLHLCGQIKILCTKLVDFDVANLRDCDRLNILIKRHIHLINKARELSDTVSFALLVQLFIMSILLCIMGFQFILAVKVNNVIMIGKSLIVQCSFLSQLTLYSFIGDYLKFQMEELAQAIYQSSWYEFSDKFRRNMIFVIMRRESPVALRAGNFIMVNLSTYVNILKTSLSYLSVLRVMVET